MADIYPARVRGERTEIGRILRQDRASRLRRRNDDRIDGRAPPGARPKQRRTPGQPFGKRLQNIAGLQESIHEGVTTGLTREAFDEHDRWNDRRPQPGSAEGEDQGGSTLAALDEQ